MIVYSMAAIKGQFIDSETLRGIANSRIELRKSSNMVAVTATDENGRYELFTEPGEYTLIGKSSIHMPVKHELTGNNKVVEPGISVDLYSVKILS